MKTVLLLITLLSSLLTHAAVYRGDDAGRLLILDSDSLTHHYEDERLPSPLTPDDDCPAASHCYRTTTGTHLEQRGDHWYIRDGAALAPYTPPVHDPANRLFATEMPYAAALLDDITFTAGTVTASDDKAVTLQDWREPASGITHFLIRDGYSDAERDAINSYLRAQALATLYARRQCLATLPVDKRATLNYRVNITPAYLSPRYISAHIHEQTPCGYGGHYGITYDIKQARGLELEDLLWIGDGAPHPLADESPADQTLRETRAAWLLDALQTAAPQAMRSYPYRARDYQYPYYYLTPRGLYVGPLLPPSKAAHAHPADTLLPYSLVRRHPGILGADALP